MGSLCYWYRNRLKFLLNFSVFLYLCNKWRWILKKWDQKGKEWIALAQDRDRWRELVNVVMSLRVPQNSGNCLTSWRPVVLLVRNLFHGGCMKNKRRRDGQELWLKEDMEEESHSLTCPQTSQFQNIYQIVRNRILPQCRVLSVTAQIYTGVYIRPHAN
jgi:hypothetical protein